MSILDMLNQEHAVFRGVLARIEHNLLWSGPGRKEEAQDMMLGLFPALDRHEELEGIVFQKGAFGDDAEADHFIAIVEAQHREVLKLRADLLRLLERADRSDSARFKTTALLFVERLKRHFDTEEKRLWPVFSRNLTRSVGQSIEHRAQKRWEELRNAMTPRQEAL